MTNAAPGTYAAGTEVTPQKSRAEIERTLTRYGAREFAVGTSPTQAVIAFVANGRHVRLTLPLPEAGSPEFATGPGGKRRTAAQQVAAHEAEVRRRWRALVLIIKAKLEAVASQVVSFETEFAAWVVLPDGHTVSEYLLPAIQEAYATGQVPPLLPGMPTLPAISSEVAS